MRYSDRRHITIAVCAGLDSVLSAEPLTVKRSNNRGLLTGSLTCINSAADYDGSVIVSRASGLSDYLSLSGVRLHGCKNTYNADDNYFTKETGRISIMPISLK